MKRRYWDSSHGTSTSRLHHLPSLSTSTSPPPQPTSSSALYAANLKDEALYLASILRARLSDSAIGGDGRGLLSRALARGELDQFLVAFFSDPANLLFAREKVSFGGVQKCVNAFGRDDELFVVLFVSTFVLSEWQGYCLFGNTAAVRVIVLLLYAPSLWNFSAPA